MANKKYQVFAKVNGIKHKKMIETDNYDFACKIEDDYKKKGVSVFVWEV